MEYENIDEILDDNSLIFARLFYLYLDISSKTIVNKDKILKKYINKLSSYYKLKKAILNKDQIVFLLKIILSFFQIINRTEINEEKNSESEFEEDLKSLMTLEQYKELKNEFTIEDIISCLIKNIIRYSVNQNYPLNEKITTPEQKWNQNGLHLENFEINETIRGELMIFLLKNKIFEKFFEEIDLKENLKDSKNNKKILSDIYEYLQFKSIRKREKLRIKNGGDLERENDDYARLLLIKETDDYSEYIPSFNKTELTNIRKILKRWLIKINLDEVFHQNEFKYFIYDDYSKQWTELSYLIETGFGDYNKRSEIKIYKKYLEFKEEVSDYIKRYSSLINYKTDIFLELQPVNKTQREEVLSEESSRKDLIKDIPEVKCISYFMKNNKKILYKDENVLLYGIYNKLQGFIFMINELCNIDYYEKPKEKENQTTN